MKAEIGKSYIHYKNQNAYTVVAIGKLEGDIHEVEYVVYRAEYNTLDHGDNPTWIRPRHEFESEVEYNSVTMQRFTRVES